MPLLFLIVSALFVEKFVDDISRAGLYLFIYPRNVMPDYSKGQHYYTSDKKQQEYDGGHTFNGSADYLVNQAPYAHDYRNDKNQRSAPSHHLHGVGGKARNGGHGIFKKLLG